MTCERHVKNSWALRESRVRDSIVGKWGPGRWRVKVILEMCETDKEDWRQRRKGNSCSINKDWLGCWCSFIRLITSNPCTRSCVREKDINKAWQEKGKKGSRAVCGPECVIHSWYTGQLIDLYWNGGQVNIKSDGELREKGQMHLEIIPQLIIIKLLFWQSFMKVLIWSISALRSQRQFSATKAPLSPTCLTQFLVPSLNRQPSDNAVVLRGKISVTQGIKDKRGGKKGGWKKSQQKIKGMRKGTKGVWAPVLREYGWS